jgi:uncharacterized protein (DUF302 family)
MRMTTRIWMTGCMALVLVAAGRWPVRDEQDSDADADQRGQRTRITMTSKYDLDETIRQVERSVRRSGLPVVARAVPRAPQGGALVHEGARVLVLGDEGGRTPVMQADGGMSTELPWQVLIRQRPDGQTEVSMPDAEAMALSLPEEIGRETLDKVTALSGVLKSAIT